MVHGTTSINLRHTSASFAGFTPRRQRGKMLLVSAGTPDTKIFLQLAMVIMISNARGEAERSVFTLSRTSNGPNFISQLKRVLCPWIFTLSAQPFFVWVFMMARCWFMISGISTRSLSIVLMWELRSTQTLFGRSPGTPTFPKTSTFIPFLLMEGSWIGC